MKQRTGKGNTCGRRFLGCTLVAASLVASAQPSTALAAGSLAGQTIVVDPGHGGIDGGATAFGRVEKTVTLPIGLDLSALLRGAGARVIVTRNSDTFVSLAARTAITNAAGADAFVSIHANALNDLSFSGVTTFYGAASGFVTGVRRSPALVAASARLATDVQAATQARTGEIDRGVQPATYYVLGDAGIPTILIETGYITNPAEGQRLTNPAYQEALAAGIADGLAQFAHHPNLSTPTALTIGPGAGVTSIAPAPVQYVVRPGDTLSAIAVHFGVAEAVLRTSNGLGSPNLIVAGRTLNVPSVAATVPLSTGAVGDTAESPIHASTPDGRALQTYTVRPGDTLSAIAVRFGTTETALRTANTLSTSDLIYAGQALAITHGSTALEMPVASAAPNAARPSGRRVQGGSVYTVRRGDTLTAIAQRLGLSVSALARANGLRDKDRLLAGQALQLQDEGQASAAAHLAPATAPGGQPNRIRVGDGLSGIARHFGTPGRGLAAAHQRSD